MGDYVTLTDSNFASETANGNWVVDFWAPWCGPCRVVGPVIEQLGTEYKGKIHVGKMNVDENPETPGNFGITGIPNVLFFKNGAKVADIVGSVGKETYVAKIKEVFGV